MNEKFERYYIDGKQICLGGSIELLIDGDWVVGKN